MAGRGVLLDVARSRGVDVLEPGFAIGGDELEQCARDQGVEVGVGDIVLVRTGQVGEVRRRGAWQDYAGGSAPGLGLSSAPWLREHDVAAVATDTWGMEVLPNETADVFQPMHIILIVHMGLWVGEIFDLEQLGSRCADVAAVGVPDQRSAAAVHQSRRLAREPDRVPLRSRHAVGRATEDTACTSTSPATTAGRSRSTTRSAVGPRSVRSTAPLRDLRTRTSRRRMTGQRRGRPPARRRSDSRGGISSGVSASAPASAS